MFPERRTNINVDCQDESLNMIQIPDFRVKDFNCLKLNENDTSRFRSTLLFMLNIISLRLWNVSVRDTGIRNSRIGNVSFGCFVDFKFPFKSIDQSWVKKYLKNSPWSVLIDAVMDVSKCGSKIFDDKQITSRVGKCQNHRHWESGWERNCFWYC